MRSISQIVDWIATPYTVYLIIKDQTVSRSAKLRAVGGLLFLLAYIISPIDIIPDFIPFAGWIDDLIAVPLVLALVRKITPEIDVIEKRNRVQTAFRRKVIPIILVVVAVFVLVLIWFGFLIYFVVRLIAR